VAGARRPYEALNRQGAVRKRKGDVYEMNGHQFVQKQFYQPVMCALCQEFLLTGEGYSCEDCRYTCHKKCYPKVVTKCISKSNADGVSLRSLSSSWRDEEEKDKAIQKHHRAVLTMAGRRGQDQSPHSAPLHWLYQHVCQLVLPLRSTTAFWS
jgi:hypothetical protein